ncbi:MAG: phosphatase PAP2 family protein [Chthoniobacteraceae bacterium]
MDQKLLFLINREWTHPAADSFMALLSSWDAWWPLVVVLVIVVAIRGGFRARAFLLTAALAAGVSDGLVCKPLKSIVNRPRPHQSVEGVRQVDLRKARPRILALAEPVKAKLSRPPKPGEPIDGRSFPSSHTGTTSAIAFVAFAFYRRRGLWALLIPLSVGYSRVYTGSHWPSDVLWSLFIGMAAGAIALALAKLLWRRFGHRVLPQAHAAHPTLLPS